jgi:ubiquinone/menaquinone biosynthesis C-methylase UbiE
MSNPGPFSGNVPEYYDELLGPVLFEPFAIDLVKRIRVTPRHTLELCAGTGRLTVHLYKHIKGELVVTDLDEGMLALAKEKLAGNRISWLVADAQDLPFNNEQFDLIVCQFGFMFFSKKEKAFCEAARVLKKEGRLLFNVWDNLSSNPRQLLLQEALNELISDAPDLSKKGPYSFNDVSFIRACLERAGFNDIQHFIVNTTSYFRNPDELVKGFIEGSSLGAFLEKRSPELKIRVAQKMKEKLGYRFGEKGVENQMQAIVFDAGKE